MDIVKELETIYLRKMLVEAHMGDAHARDAYKELIREAEGDAYRTLWLLYLRESVLRELLENFVDKTLGMG